jgi:hypothetical protein
MHMKKKKNRNFYGNRYVRKPFVFGKIKKMKPKENAMVCAFKFHITMHFLLNYVLVFFTKK